MHHPIIILQYMSREFFRIRSIPEGLIYLFYLKESCNIYMSKLSDARYHNYIQLSYVFDIDFSSRKIITTSSLISVALSVVEFTLAGFRQVEPCSPSSNTFVLNTVITIKVHLLHFNPLFEWMIQGNLTMSYASHQRSRYVKCF